MSDHNKEVKVNFGSTAILSFVIVFSILLLMSNCHGPYHVAAPEKASSEQKG